MKNCPTSQGNRSFWYIQASWDLTGEAGNSLIKKLIKKILGARALNLEHSGCERVRYPLHYQKLLAQMSCKLRLDAMFNRSISG